MRRRLARTTITALALTVALGGCAVEDEPGDPTINEDTGVEDEPIEGVPDAEGETD